MLVSVVGSVAVLQASSIVEAFRLGCLARFDCEEGEMSCAPNWAVRKGVSRLRSQLWPGGLSVQKLGADARVWELTRIELSKQAVTIAGYKIVSGVAQGWRDKLAQVTDEPPAIAEFTERVDHCVRA